MSFDEPLRGMREGKAQKRPSADALLPETNVHEGIESPLSGGLERGQSIQ